MIIRCLALSLIALNLSACKIYGSAEKGPFKTGSTITATELDAQANLINSSSRSTTVDNDQGSFLVTRINWSGWTQVTATGLYFNEFLGVDSTASIELNAISDKDVFLDTVNTHLFSTLAASRIRQLVANGQSINDAWAATQLDMANTFGLTNLDVDGVEQLDLLDGTSTNAANNAILLLFSGGFLDIGGDTATLNTLSADFADDAQFNGVGASIFNSIAVSAGQTNLLNTLSTNLIANGAANPPNTADLSVLPQWITDASGTNQAPVANAQSITVDEDSSNNSIMLTGSDANGDALSFSITEQPNNGSVTLSSTEASFTPDPNFFGNDSFTFVINDGIDNSLPAIVSITVTDVAEPNIAPTAESQNIEVVQDTRNNPITLTGNDPDGDNNALVYAITTQPTNGQFVTSSVAPNLVYKPNAGYVGADSFSFTVDDGIDVSEPATVTINVTEEVITYPEVITITGMATFGPQFFIEAINVTINGVLVSTASTPVEYNFSRTVNTNLDENFESGEDDIKIEIFAQYDGGSISGSVVTGLQQNQTTYDIGEITLSPIQQ